MTFKTDNRWSTGSIETPETAIAAYGARWIDRSGRADIVPDRQGFAYNETADRERLIQVLIETDAQTLHNGLPHDEIHCVVKRDDAEVWVRRAGGYVYVAAWLVA